MNEGVENKAVEPPRPLYRFYSLIDEHSPRKRKISSSTLKQSKIPTLLVLDCGWFSLLLRDSVYPLAWLSFDTEKKESFVDKVPILSI